MRVGLSKSPRAFTLIEVLVACAVLAMLVALIAQVLSATRTTTAESRRKIETDKEARTALDRMAFDIARMLKREDVAFSFSKTNGNDSMSFFSEVPGKGTGSTISQVSYRIAANGGLERAATRVAWESIVFNTDSPPTPADADFRTLAPSVFRMEITFIFRGDYTDVNNPDRNPLIQTLTDSLPAVSATKATTWKKDLLSVIVSLAALDRENRAKLGTQQASPLGINLPDGNSTACKDATLPDSFPIAPNPTTQIWSTAVAGTTFSGVPRVVSSQIRIYSRVITLP